MNHYTHFTLKERELLKHFLDIGKNQTEISTLLGKNILVKDLILTLGINSFIFCNCILFIRLSIIFNADIFKNSLLFLISGL